MLLACISAIIGLQAQSVIFPQEKQPGKAEITKIGSSYILKNNLFEAKYNLTDGKLFFGGSNELGLVAGTDLFKILLGDSTMVSSSEMKMSGVKIKRLTGKASASRGSEKLDGAELEATFTYGPITVKWASVLRNGSHYLRTVMNISSSKDIEMKAIYPMMYGLREIPGQSLPEIVGNTRGAILCGSNIFAGLETPMGINSVGPGEISTPGISVPMIGKWSRVTTLSPGKEWKIGSVVGLVAPNQARRSFLAYSERERAVPWRPFPVYNSWYELNIDRNNSAPPTYEGHMTEKDCADLVSTWKNNLYKQYGENIACMVFDDGWDEYGTWTFNCNFPHGFAAADSVARTMNTGIGAWLGPVGGYGTSGDYRRGYWKDKGGMQLSNPDYYKVFLDACSNLVNDYDFRYFKLDGISAQFSSVGPDPGAVGDENAEGIIELETKVRELRPDIFLNTSVGTWASPMWFQYTDAVWRQEGDHGTIGTGANDRETWITYRDRLVHKNFVENSPLCPINTLMTHGVILTKYGDVSKDMSYQSILNELRCAFACGSGMVELYMDAPLLDSIERGKLWSDIAQCIKWQKDNADVLPDIHWVGGNPWDGEKGAIYGWAAWNGNRSVLTLRNPAKDEDSIQITLREALDIPYYVKSPVILKNAFADQPNLKGIPIGQPIGIDTPLTITLPGSSVYIFNGVSK